MKITVNSNGHNKAGDMENITQVETLEVTPIEATEQPAPKKKTTRSNNKTANFYLDIDAGAKRVKCRLNGVYKAFPSEAKEIKNDVPLRTDGCFSYGTKNYVVGKGIDRVNGKLIVASQDNKLSRLDVWIVGAITHYRKQLKELVKNRRRKVSPTKINLHLRVLTLSSMKRKELDKALKNISAFTWEDNDFELNVKSLEFIEEGQGAAELITRDNEDIETFHLIDLGGGTFTHTTYDWDGDELSIVARTPISGAGMQSVINKIFKAMTRVDRGAIQAENQDIQEALELSAVSEKGYSVPLRSNGKVEDIANEVEGALSEWVSGNYALLKQFDLISQKLARGESVYCSGGGFAVKVVADWIINYLCDGIPDAKIGILESPQHINLTGLEAREA